MSATVLLVNDLATVGGGQTVMLDVARVLLDAGFDVHVASPSGHLADRSTAMGVQWHDFRYTQRRLLTPRYRLPRPQAMVARIDEGRRLAALAHQVGADIVHTGALIPHVDAKFGRLPVRVVWHVNQMHPAYLFAGPLPDRIISVSRAALRPAAWRPAVAERSAVVPNGVDVDRFRPPSAAERTRAREAHGLGDDFTVVTVARLEPLKGVDTVIRAAARCSLKPVVLVVGDATGYGGGHGYADGLQALAADLSVDARFLGSRADVDEVLWAADVFAFASRWEAFGLVLAEASASALPVVSGDSGGCPEVVDGSTGVLVGVDDVAAFAEAFDRLAGDPSLRRRLGAAGRQRATEAFDVARLGERLLPHYFELAGVRS